MVEVQTKHYVVKTDSYDEKHLQIVGHVASRGCGTRHVQIAVMSIAAFMAYALRTNLSVAIVAMVKYNETTSTSPSLAETYAWGEDVQGYILSSFFWGYLVLQIPAGIITEKFGGHRFLCFGVLASSTFTLVFPQCTYYGGWPLVCINRMLQGICQGFVFPSIFTLLGVWSPPMETSTLSSFAVGGQLLGAVAATPISSYLCSAYGWPFVFYSFGAAGLITGIVMLFLGADTPAKHRIISDAERKYIEKSLGGAKVQMKIPWMHVMSNLPFWSALLAMSFDSLVYLMLLTKIPTYLATVLKFSMDDNGLLSALPFFVSWLSSFFFSWSCKLLTNRGYLSVTAARKLFNSICHFGGAVCIIAMGHTEDRVMSVFLLTAFMGVQGATFTGVQANFVDLAPNFAGPIFSVANFSTACLGVTGPIIVGCIVTEAGSAAQWRIVFYLCAAFLVLSNIVYIVFGTAETQWWNWPDKYEDKSYFDEEKEKDSETCSLEKDL